MATITETQQQAITMIVKAVVDTVKEAGTDGAPSGILYAALMSHGCKLSQFTSLMSALVNRGIVRLENDVYYYTGR